MIDMQYNFPLLPGQVEVWQEHLLTAVGEGSRAGFGALRPTFQAPVSGLREALASWFSLPAERLTLTGGAHHGSLCAMMAAGLAGKAIAVDAVAYSGAMFQMQALGCPVVGCAVDDKGLTPDALEAACRHAQARGTPVAAVFLTPTVHNPLGITVPSARREALVAVARRWDLLFLEDDTYGFLDAEPPPRFCDLAPERTFYINTLSKSIAPAVRTGVLLAPERFHADVAAAVKNTATGNSAVHQRAALSMLQEGELDRLVIAKRDEGAQRNAAARSLLGAVCWPGAACAWHLWVNLPKTVTPESFEAQMAARGVAVSGGNWFTAGPNAPRGVRLALGGEVTRERALEGVALVAAELAS